MEILAKNGSFNLFTNTSSLAKLFFPIILICAFCHEGNAATTPEEYNKKLEKIAEGGNAEAQYQLGMRLSEWGGTYEKNYEKAFYWFEKAAELGHPQAQNQFAYLHTIQRPGLKKIDSEEANKWYLKAAENGNDKAQFTYALINEKSLPKDKFFMWLNKAAEQDNAFAQYTLSTYYFNGQNNISKDMPKDFESAYAWLMITANRNDLWNIKKDEDKIDQFKEKLSPEQLDSANNKILKLTELIEKNVNDNQAKRVQSLCKMYEQMGTEYEKCIIWQNQVILDAKKKGQIYYY